MTTPRDAYAYIDDKIVPEVLDLFRRKQKDYSGGQAFLFLGSRGEFSDINRKFWKLYRAVWEGDDLTEEDAMEVCSDMIGHLFLLIFTLKEDGGFLPGSFYGKPSIDETNICSREYIGKPPHCGDPLCFKLHPEKSR